MKSGTVRKENRSQTAENSYNVSTLFNLKKYFGSKNDRVNFQAAFFVPISINYLK